ncbi:SH3 domain-containing protein [Halocynthiibacter sp.]|uniref:SH3 domain-containing protein n=1 Tax=Halocynthiibacter sp. TaxID=1979210 RepID=UPI003C3C654E
MRRLFIILFCQLCLSAPVFAQDLPRLYRVVDVAANDVLNIRQHPSADSPIIGVLHPGADKVEVTHALTDGRWGHVNSGEQSGWVYMRYMQDMGDPSWWELKRPLFCFGTEPFWNTVIDADTSGGMRFQRPGHERQDFQYDWMRRDTGFGTPDSPKGVAANFASPERRSVAILQDASCGDGMSDRDYSISIRLIMSLADPDNKYASEVYDGCCSLTRP